MSLALPDDGKLICLDKNQEKIKIANNFFKKAKQENKIETIVKPALDSLIELNRNKKKFDLIFIDADKENNINYYNQSISLLNPDALIIIDNVLWHGEIADKMNQDKITLAIRKFNSYVNNDKRTENLIIPLGDGLSVCRKL